MRRRGRRGGGWASGGKGVGGHVSRRRRELKVEVGSHVETFRTKVAPTLLYGVSTLIAPSQLLELLINFSTNTCLVDKPH